MIHSAEDVEALGYVDFISLLRETNRCPGGKQTVRKIIQNAFLSRESKVLEIGANTGFTALELARTIRCSVVGIDVSQAAVDTANAMLATDLPEVQERVKFQFGSAYDLAFGADLFDLVIAGGATSFMDKKTAALREYHRVLKPWGFLSVTNLYYESAPPSRLVDEVSDVLGVRIEPWGFEDWVKLFKTNGLFEVYFLQKNRMTARPTEAMVQYIDYFMAKEHLQTYPWEVRDAIRRRWTRTLAVFNENHNHLGFLIGIFRKTVLEEEVELFTDYKQIDLGSLHL